MRRVGSRTSLPTFWSRVASCRSRRAVTTRARQGSSMRRNQPLKRSASSGPPRPTSMAAATLASTSSSTPARDRGRRMVASPAWRVSGEAWMGPAAARRRSVAAARDSPDRSTPPTRTPRRTSPAAVSSWAASSPPASTTTSSPARATRGTRPTRPRAAASGLRQPAGAGRRRRLGRRGVEPGPGWPGRRSLGLGGRVGDRDGGLLWHAVRSGRTTRHRPRAGEVAGRTESLRPWPPPGKPIPARCGQAGQTLQLGGPADERLVLVGQGDGGGLVAGLGPQVGDRLDGVGDDQDPVVPPGSVPPRRLRTAGGRP